ncbi:hypothetical protein BVC80_1227g31 [Macleaya cordata]|uniref:Uncharacterized protein n=1 Tax=Macleaya cordata TaxID=56857 RepID=A0A200R8D2_MACCD|nr:hypothetical protein BVC80_1227g31 [Macleaya cordata]
MQAQKVAHLFKIKINLGSDASFWFDLWSPSQTEPLKVTTPTLFRISTKKVGRISDFVTTGAQCSWNFEFSRDIRNSEIPTLARLLVVIGDNPPVGTTWQTSATGHSQTKGILQLNLYTTISVVLLQPDTLQDSSGTSGYPSRSTSFAG